MPGFDNFYRRISQFPEYNKAIEFAFLELSLLRPRFCFHNSHRAKEVLGAVEKLINQKDIDSRPKWLLKTAAVYDFLGYVYKYNKSKQMSRRLTKEILPNYGYNAKEISEIQGMIMAAKIPQKPRTDLQKILCDAKLDYLGKENFFDKLELLRQEKSNHRINFTQQEFYQEVYNLFREKNYFTKSARKLWGEKRKENFQELEKILEINEVL